MFKISIKGMADGKHHVNAVALCEEIEGMFSEFFGEISLVGEMHKIGKRYILSAQSQCQARLLCDISGEEFVEVITATFTLNYIANTQMFLLQSEEIDPEQPYYIRDDDTWINVTEEVRQELIVALPLKRIAPQYRDKEFADIFPNAAAETQSSETSIDERWAALKNISFDKK